MSYYDDGMMEEALKIKVSKDWFGQFDYSINGRIDFVLSVKNNENDHCHILWAEAKKGRNHSIIESFVQLILTIGRKNGTSRIIDEEETPVYISAFDAEKIAFVPIEAIENIFDKNDFDWTVTPSNHESKEFKELQEILEETLSKSKLQFNYEEDAVGLRTFIENALLQNSSDFQQKITDRNFARIFHKWEKQVLPSIGINWNKTKGILPRDFYLADLLSENGIGLVENLFVVLKSDQYSRKLADDVLGLGVETEIHYHFLDGQKAYTAFWNRYKRPPQKQFWDKIMARIDLLVPVDIRERKGAFFTPQIWVEKSQEYLAKTLGENWQEEYYIWDCCAGTGNLEVGLQKPLRIWRSTLDEADVAIMKELCRESEKYKDEHIFQFDFLNGDFKDLPGSLKQVIDNEEKRRHLVIYINPPYAEASSYDTINGGDAKNAVEQTKANGKYAKMLGQANAELFAQFFVRIYDEIHGCILAEFSTLKHLQGPHFSEFRNYFRAKILNSFIVPASTFDNVNGKFPIGFFIFDTSEKIKFRSILANVFDSTGKFIGQKSICNFEDRKFMNDWVKPHRATKSDMLIGKFPFKGNDFQNTKMVALVNPERPYSVAAGQFLISNSNLFFAVVYFAARHCIEQTWLNDRDQYLYPNDDWEKDYDFKNNCLIYTLFHSQNKISSKYGTNHWIPFAEEEIGVVTEYDSHFMIDFIQGKIQMKSPSQLNLFDDGNISDGSKQSSIAPLHFTEEAEVVLDAGRELYKYYHTQKDATPNASLYDIKEYFKGRNEKGKMNNTSKDEQFNALFDNLNNAMKNLENKIVPKVYEYGFLADKFVPDANLNI